MAHAWSRVTGGLLLVLVAAAGERPATAQDGAREPVVFRRAMIAKVKGFDPALADDLYAGTSSQQIYEPLYEFHYLKRPIEAVPLTAAALPTVSADGLTLTIPLKRGIRFHDDACFPGGKGRELVAGDFVYAWKRVADPKNESPLWAYLQDQIVGLDEWSDAAGDAEQADYDAPIAGLTAPDPYTLVIRLTKVNPQFRYFLAMVFTAAVPREAVQKYGADFPNHAVGTGAFRLKSWVRDSRFVLERHPGYHDMRYPAEGEPASGSFPGDAALGRLAHAGERAPLCDRCEIDIITEDQPFWLQFETGAADISSIPKDAYGRAIKDFKVADDLAKREITLERVSDLDLTYTVFNMHDPLLGKHRLLRAAIASATNEVQVREIFHNGRAALAQSPVPPGLFGYDPAYRHPYPFDLARAKTLLAEAGFPDGVGLPELVYDSSGTDATSRQMAELVQQQLAAIGIRLKVVMNHWPAFSEKINKGLGQIWGVGWGADYPDPENFLQLFYGPHAAPAGQNGSRFQDPAYDRAFEAMRILPDGPERLAKVREMIDIVNREVPYIPGLHREAWVLSHPWCRTYKYPQVGGGYWKYQSVDMAMRRRLLGK